MSQVAFDSARGRTYGDKELSETLIAFDTGGPEGRCYGFIERHMPCAEHHVIHCYWSEWQLGNMGVLESQWDHAL